MTVAELKEYHFQDTIRRVKENKFTHVTSVMVTEEQLNTLRAMFISASVPYSGNGKCFLLCKG